MMVSRRDLLAGLMAAGGLAASGHGAQAAVSAWQRWYARYSDGGRIIDDGQSGMSHSEGQGYAMVLAQAAGDRAAFDQIEAWTARHLQVRQDRLMAWNWQPDRSANIADWHNATDGDLFRAWALLRAARDSGWPGHLETAIAIARDISALCLAPDPRAPDELLLTPGAESRRDAGRVLFNPSYIMPRALQELGEAAGDERLIRAALHGETVLAELAATGLLPNWVDITAEGFAPPAEHAWRWGYDALRIPLYLVWSDRPSHPAVALARRRMLQGAEPGKVVVEADANGRITAQSDQSGYLALATIARDDPAACADAGEVQDEEQGYYPAILALMADVARREGPCA